MGNYVITLLLLPVIVGLGCRKDKPAPEAVNWAAARLPTPLAHDVFNGDRDVNATSGLPQARNPKDPQPAVPILVGLSIYKFLVPRGSVSGSAEFWKHIDEHQIDPFHYDVIQKNGIRAGVAPQSDWEYFRDILQRHPAVFQSSETASAKTASLEISVKQSVIWQSLLVSHGTGELDGQAYDRCDNIMVLVFAPYLREPGVVHARLTPLVRSQRERIDVTAMGSELHSLFIRPEYYFDVDLDINIPLNHFLVVAPSSEAVNLTSIGHNFLVQEGKGQELETLLLFSPHPFQLQPPPTSTVATQPTAEAGK